MGSNHSQTTSGPHFSVHEDFGGSVARLSLIGELDRSTVPVLEDGLRRVEENGDVAIIVDLQRLEFVDCRGLSAFVAAQRRASARCNHLLLMNARPEVRRLLNLTDLSHLLSPPRIAPPLFVDVASFVADDSSLGDLERDRIPS